MRYPKELKLWPHQIGAVESVSRYLDQGVQTRRRSVPSALVNIPTGGGKTAVIGTLAHWHQKLDSVLILSPRVSIRRQLVQELSASRGFFRRHGYEATTLPKRVVSVAARHDIPKQRLEGSILVSTIQLVVDLLSDHDGKLVYDRLAAGCQAIIVDEGHYEPAPTWSGAIRGLQRPIVLVTATPYRNDLKSFEIDPQAIWISRYRELATQHYLRRVETAIEPSSARRSEADFVDSVLSTFVRTYKSAPSGERKLIVRCKTPDQIRRIADEIRGHRYGDGGVLCLHEAFGSDANRPWEVKQPPDPELPNSPAIWIHQHKLLEGVDGPSFRALAVYGVLGSARALVQQIGRIVRNPNRDKKEHALLIDHYEGLVERMWHRFEHYDSLITRENLSASFNTVLNELESLEPAIVYVDRQFRSKLRLMDFSEAEAHRSLRLPLRGHLYESRADSLDQLKEAAKRRFDEEDCPYTTAVSNDELLLMLFVQIGSSMFLSEHYFLEPKLHVFLAARRRGVTVLLDTSRPGPDSNALQALGKPVSRSVLSKLLAGNRDIRIVEVNARNAALGPATVRRRALFAPSLAETPPSLDEFQFVASSISAVDDSADSREFSERSIGFARGRISDRSLLVPLKTWLDWADQLVATSHDRATRGPSYMERFAQPLDREPARPWPRSALLDLGEIRERFVVSTADGDGAEPVAMDIAEVSLECQAVPGQPGAPRPVTIVANGTVCSGTFEYRDGLYWLSSSELEQRYRPKEASDGGNVVKEINAAQSFIVVPEEPNTIYSEGGFYRPGLRLGAAFDARALGLNALIEVKGQLRTCTTEKGRRDSALGTTWAHGSVFRWIDDNPDELLADARLIVCDDGNRECCDFLVVGRRERRDVVVMVHAKAPHAPSRVSASSLHDVCSQATKNMGTVALFRPQKPQQLHLWTGPWIGPSGEGRVDSRVRRARGEWAGLTGSQIWTKVEALVQRHDTQREVALVLGSALRRDDLFAGARRAQPEAKIVTALHLIRGTMSSVVGGGARLRIFCD